MTVSYIFDLDGTLVDTAPDLLQALNAVMKAAGRRAFSAAELAHLVGRGVESLIDEAFRMSGDPLDPARLPAVLDGFRDHYRAHIADRSRPYTGAVATLETLAAQGAPMGVLTNKPHDMAMDLLPKLDLMRFFGAVYGAGLRPYIKPDARLFAEILADLGGTGGPSVMIGDSITDVETARGAGVPVVLVSYGYTPVPAAELGADAVVDRFTDIPAAAAKLLGI